MAAPRIVQAIGLGGEQAKKVAMAFQTTQVESKTEWGARIKR